VRNSAPFLPEAGLIGNRSRAFRKSRSRLDTVGGAGGSRSESMPRAGVWGFSMDQNGQAGFFASLLTGTRTWLPPVSMSCSTKCWT